VVFFAFSGVSFDASRRLAALASDLASDARPHERLYEQAMGFAYRVLEGDWSSEHEIDPTLLEESVRLGHLWAPVTYLGLLAEKRVHEGNLEGAEDVRRQLDEIWEVYRYDLAKTNLLWLRAIIPLELGQLEEAHRGATLYYEENPEDLLHLLGLGLRAQIEIRMGRLDDAEATLAEAETVAARSKPVPPFHGSRYLGARLMLDIERLAASGGNDRSRRASARRSLKAVVANSTKMAFTRVEMLRLAGRFEWLEGHHGRSLKLYEQSLSAAESLCAGAAGARTWAEVADRLTEDGRGPKRFRELDSQACRAEAEVEFRSPNITPHGYRRSVDR